MSIGEKIYWFVFSFLLGLTFITLLVGLVNKL